MAAERSCDGRARSCSNRDPHLFRNFFDDFLDFCHDFLDETSLAANDL